MATLTPDRIIDFTNWKITLPVGKSEHPDEHLSAELKRGEEWPPYFWADESDRSVVFRAPVKGVTTSGSGYPRSELREMSGSKGAAWSGTDGKYHTGVVELSFTAYPIGKPHVVGFQIHGDKDDYSVLRLEGPNLWVTQGDGKFKLIMNNYRLGQRIQFAFQVYNGKCVAYLNGMPVATLDAKKLKGAYFKTGCYTQANTSSKGVDKNGWGEVKVFQVKVSHGTDKAPVVLPKLPPTETVPPVEEPQPPVEQPPTPVERAKRVLIVLRHAEKDDNADGKEDRLHELSAKGIERALKLAEAFQDPEWLKAKGLYKPDRVIASKGGTKSERPVQTVTPLVEQTGLPLNTRYDFEEQEEEVGKWLAQRLDITMVCGEHSAMVNMCKAFGTISPALPKTYADRYDVIWKFESDDGKTWKFTQIPQMLMDGDKNTVMK